MSYAKIIVDFIIWPVLLFLLRLSDAVEKDQAAAQGHNSHSLLEKARKGLIWNNADK